MLKLLSALRKNEEGASLVEYTLLVALIAVAAITVLGLLGGEVDRILEVVLTSLQGANP